MSPIPWFKVDDGLAFNAKFIALPLPAAGLWVRAGAWCAQQLTDGRIPAPVVAAIGGRPAETDALVAADLWEATPEGWCFHDWTEYQPAAETVRAERDAAAARMRDRRAKWKGVKGGSGERSDDVQANVQPNTGRTFDRSSEEVRDVFEDPDPSLPYPSPSPLPTPPTSREGRAPRTTGTRLPDDFPITDDMRAWASQNAPNATPRDHDSFCDYWHAKAGKDATKVDWLATWRNWMRRESDGRGNGTARPPTGPRPAPPTPLERAAGVADAARRLKERNDARQLRAIGD